MFVAQACSVGKKRYAGSGGDKQSAGSWAPAVKQFLEFFG